MQQLLSRSITISVLFVSLLAWGLSGAAMADTILNFGVYTADKPTSVVRQFRPLLSGLEQRLSLLRGEPVKIRIQVAKNYQTGIDDLVKGRVDFSRFGPVSYILAKRQNPSLSIIVAESKQGKKEYNGVICVHKDSPIKRIEELAGKRFAFGNQRSTVGRYLSQLYLVEHGVRESDLASYDYLGRHDKVGMAVAAGTHDAGALKESTFFKLAKKGKPLRQLVTFPLVTKPWIARAGLAPELRAQLRQALLEFRDDKAFKALKKDGFLPADDTDYDRIRRAIEQNEQFFAD
ncbi:phosphate/phosphite/phosphonate ABC transporter substrate-binding protein [Candidatus Endoriftia persephonae]|jgi:phosphonate transport system substrate-binding protein|uniref:Phosphate/phosphite/phosphonate ABC transporter substrate-binding protein n=1 Tax=Candidatus Endoriftia persephonae TaxID=393765 RepID=A0A9J6ZXP4_9GAMM|nr:phosphate/phosphite/phosphonate ABC transporter substrate-binding protein [Candidatus Endoriftia persephone]USF87562.1 phosphate/phosphite/phosphonate ABC transporter substrate-binding protein [Candidatus Endoriftia persephone]